MKILKINIIFMALIVPVIVYSNKKVISPKQNRVLIFGFDNKNNIKKYRYLSRILPKTISLELKKDPSYKITTVLNESPAGELNKIEVSEKKQEYLLSLYKKYDSEFIVMGSFSIDEEGLKIDGVLFSKFEIVAHRISDFSTEKGAELVKIIDSISVKLGKRIALSIDEKIRKENTYVAEFKDKPVSIKPYFVWDNFSIELFSGGRNNKISFAPNTTWKYGINFTVYNFALSFSTDLFLSALQKDEYDYGKSTNFDTSLHYFWKYIALDANFKYYKGFYLTNTDSFVPAWQGGDPYKQLSDMKYYSGGLNLYYIVSGEKFSMGAATNQTDLQKKNAGSFLLKLSTNFFSIHDDYPLIAPMYDSYYGEMAGFNDGKFYSISLSPGFSITFVIGNFFITPELFMGAGGQYQIVDTFAGEKKWLRYLLDVNFKSTLGYNGSSFITGITFVYHNSRNYMKDSEIDIYTMNANYFIGMRF